VGFFKDRAEIYALASTGKIFISEVGESERAKAISGWRRAVRACRVFTEEE
jgi:glycerol kinase